MGMASSRSRPLPCGTPSMMSMRTTSASSLEVIQWAAVAPTLPEPTMVTFLRMASFRDKSKTKALPQGAVVITEEVRAYKPLCSLCPLWLMVLRWRQNCAHVLDNAICKFAGADFGCAWHQALEIVRHLFLFEGAFEAAFDQVGGFV